MSQNTSPDASAADELPTPERPVRPKRQVPTRQLILGALIGLIGGEITRLFAARLATVELAPPAGADILLLWTTLESFLLESVAVGFSDTELSITWLQIICLAVLGLFANHALGWRHRLKRMTDQSRRELDAREGRAAELVALWTSRGFGELIPSTAALPAPSEAALLAAGSTQSVRSEIAPESAPEEPITASPDPSTVLPADDVASAQTDDAVAAETDDPIELLAAGRLAADSGDLATAFELFTRALDLDPRSEAAWLGISEVTADPEEERSCLEMVLTLEPDHEIAARRLAEIERGSQTRAAKGPDSGPAPVQLEPTSAPGEPDPDEAVPAETHSAADPSVDDYPATSSDWLAPPAEETVASDESSPPSLSASPKKRRRSPTRRLRRRVA